MWTRTGAETPNNADHSILTLCLFSFQDAEMIEKLNECGELRQILKPYKVRFDQNLIGGGNLTF